MTRASPSLPAAAPTARSQTLDAVRALALIGVLVINMLTLSGLRYLGPEALAALQGPLDRGLDLALAVLVEGKALAAFSFLFGLSFSILQAGAARRGEDFDGFFLRRLAVLAGFGLLNAVAFFWGDILVTYAVLGTFLLAAPLVSRATVLRLALALLVVPALVLALAGVEVPGPPAATRTASLEAFGADDPFSTFEHNWALYTGAVGAPDSLRLWRYGNIGGLFLLGAYAGRSGLAFALAQNRRWLAPLAAACLGIGLAMEVAAATGLARGPVATALLVAKPLMAVGYIVLAALLFDRPGMARLRAALSPLGRMALTGYLMGGLIGQAVFYGWGLGRIGETGTAAVLGWAAVIALVLAVFARLWLARFLYGPWEWLWRSLSKLKRQPMRIS